MAVGWGGRQVFGAGGAVQMPPANFKAVSRYQNTAGVDLIIDTLYGVWLAAGSIAAGFHCKGIVYDESGSLPNALLALTNELTVINAGPIALPFPSTWVWPAGAIRWLGMIADTNLTTQSSIAAVVSGGIKFNADTYSDGPTDPFGGSPSSTDLEYVIWAEGYDGAKKLGRISIGGDPTGSYFKLDAHYERFALGGVSAPVGAASQVRVTAIAVYVTSGATVNAHCALYADDGGASGTPAGATLLGVTNQLSSFSANAWHTFSFPVPILIAASGNYWLGVIFDDVGPSTNVTQYNGQLSSAGGAQTTAAFYTWSNPVSAVAPPLSDQRPKGISIYADYGLEPTASQIVFPQNAEIPARPTHVVPY